MANPECISRSEAKALGLTYYFTSKPCKRGHIDWRYVTNKHCVACAYEDLQTEGRKQYEKDLEKKKRAIRKEQKRRRYLANREQCLAYQKIWYQNNKDRSKANGHAYRARKERVSYCSNDDVEQWLSTQEKVCYWCGVECSKGYHIDHYTPLSKGGQHSLDNLVIACRSCNSSKQAKDPYDFAQEVGRLF